MPTTAADSKGPVIEETVHGAVTVRYANSDRVLSVAADSKANALITNLLRNAGLMAVERA